jgi:phage shock protein C
MEEKYDNEVLFGVCCELGNRFNIDPIVFRVIFIILALCTTFPAFLIYIILAFIL